MCVYQISAKCRSINGCGLVCKCMCFHVCARRSRVYACVRAGVHVCKFACLFICVYVKVRISVFAYECVCIGECVGKRACVSMFLYVHMHKSE